MTRNLRQGQVVNDSSKGPGDGAGQSGNVVQVDFGGSPSASLPPAPSIPAPRQLYARCKGTVNRLVWRLMGADADHDDLVQDVFVAMVKDLHTVRDPARFDGWVRTVTVNVVRAHLRRRKLMRALGLYTPTADEHRFGQVVRDEAARQLLLAVHRILDGMSPNLRVVFALRYIEGMTLPEVAEALDCGLSTVKRRLSKADELFVRRAKKVDGLVERLEASRRFKTGEDA